MRVSRTARSTAPSNRGRKMSTTAEQLMLRGLSLLVRASFSPNELVAQQKHMVSLTQDIGPWFKDYADEIAKPAVDWSVDFKQATREPQLGCATTGQLLTELRARTECHAKVGEGGSIPAYVPAHRLIAQLTNEIVMNVDGGLDYRTIDEIGRAH